MALPYVVIVGLMGFIAMFGLIFGLFMSLLSVVPLWEAWAARRWKTTSGTILFSTSAALPRLKAHYEHPEGQHQALVRYSYEVDGREYIGGRLLFGHGGGGAWAEAQLAKQYPAGKVVPVSYDPADPQQATLAREVDTPNIAWALLGTLVGVATAVGFVTLAITGFGLRDALLGFVVGGGLLYLWFRPILHAFVPPIVQRFARLLRATLAAALPPATAPAPSPSAGATAPRAQTGADTAE